MKLSVIILTKNEESKINKCLGNVMFADEVIMVDNGSSDKTIEYAKKFKVRIIKNYNNNFSYLRNLAKNYARSEWLFYVDADEIVTDKLRNEILNLINKSDNDNLCAYKIKRVNYFYGKKTLQDEFMIRLIKQNCLVEWIGALHESAIVNGEVGRLNTPLLHYTHERLERMVNKTNEWSNIESEMLLKTGHPKMNILRFIKMIIYSFYRSFITNRSYKLGKYGLIESIYQSFSTFITYAKLWEIHQKK
jgi:glycosyltransferase involved in cell wall biosynthesis